MKKCAKSRPHPFDVQLQRKAIALPHGWMNCLDTAVINWNMHRLAFQNSHMRKFIHFIRAQFIRLFAPKTITCIGGEFCHLNNANDYGRNIIDRRYEFSDILAIEFGCFNSNIYFIHRLNLRSQSDQVLVHLN